MNFFKTFLASLLAFVVANILLTVFALLVFAGMVAAFGDKPAQVRPNSILKIDLKNGIIDSPRSSSLVYSSLGGFEINTSNTLLEAVRAIENAIYDDNIRGIYLNLSNIGHVTAANAEELRRALASFREESGKFVICYSDYYTKYRYYLGSVADKVFINPEGMIEWSGMAGFVMFYRGALDKLGVKPEIIRHGTFKSAVEPFLYDRMSPENRLQTQTYLNSIWDAMLEDISVSRRVSKQSLDDLASDIDRWLNPQSYVLTGMVDDLAYEDQVLSLLSRLTAKDAGSLESEYARVFGRNGVRFEADRPVGDTRQAEQEIIAEELAEVVAVQDVTAAGEPIIMAEPISAEETAEKKVRFVSFPDYIENVNSGQRNRSKNRVAVVYIDGEIVTGEAGDGYAASETVSAKLARARRDERTKAVVVRVNSPGGSALASEVMWREIELIRREKPVVVSMGQYAASGGYYVSCPADIIVANRNTLTGSIGVFGLFFDAGEAFRDKLGVTMDVVTTNEGGDFGNYFRPMESQERNALQNFVDRTYFTFIGHVATGRNMTTHAVDDIGQGRVWAGANALEIGLVDGIGGLKEAIGIAADRAGIPGDFKVWEVVDAPDSFSMIIRSLSGQAKVKDTPVADEVYSQYRYIMDMLEKDKVQALMPYRIDIK